MNKDGFGYMCDMLYVNNRFEILKKIYNDDLTLISLVELYADLEVVIYRAEKLDLVVEIILPAEEIQDKIRQNIQMSITG